MLWNNQLTHTGMAFLGMTLVSGTGSGGCLLRPLHHVSAPATHSAGALARSFGFPDLSAPGKGALRSLSGSVCVQHDSLAQRFTRGENILHRKLVFLEAFCKF